MKKTCKKDTILNEKTGRCISVSGRRAKKLYPIKVCERQNKAYNPKTGRCVKKEGKKGKEMTKAAKKIQQVVGTRQALMRDVRNEYNKLGANAFMRQYGREMAMLSDYQQLMLLGNNRYSDLYLFRSLVNPRYARSN